MGMMRILIGALLIATTAAAASGDVSRRVTEIRNRTGTMVYSVYVSTTGTEGHWGQDQLRAETMKPQEVKVLGIIGQAGGCYLAVKVVFSNRPPIIGHDLDLCPDGSRVDITDAGVVAVS